MVGIMVSIGMLVVIVIYYYVVMIQVLPPTRKNKDRLPRYVL